MTIDIIHRQAECVHKYHILQEDNYTLPRLHKQISSGDLAYVQVDLVLLGSYSQASVKLDNSAAVFVNFGSSIKT